MIKNFLNLEGHQNPIMGSKVTVILLKGWISPIGGASALEGLQSTGLPRLVTVVTVVTLVTVLTVLTKKSFFTKNLFSQGNFFFSLKKLLHTKNHATSPHKKSRNLFRQKNHAISQQKNHATSPQKRIKQPSEKYIRQPE